MLQAYYFFRASRVVSFLFRQQLLNFQPYCSCCKALLSLHNYTRVFLEQSIFLSRLTFRNFFIIIYFLFRRFQAVGKVYFSLVAAVKCDSSSTLQPLKAFDKFAAAKRETLEGFPRSLSIPSHNMKSISITDEKCFKLGTYVIVIITITTRQYKDILFGIRYTY